MEVAQTCPRLFGEQAPDGAGEGPGMDPIRRRQIGDRHVGFCQPPFGGSNLAVRHFRAPAEALTTSARRLETLFGSHAEEMALELGETAHKGIEQLAVRCRRIDLHADDVDGDTAVAQRVQFRERFLGRPEGAVEIEDDQRVARHELTDHRLEDRTPLGDRGQALDAKLVADRREGIDLPIDALLVGADA